MTSRVAFVRALAQVEFTRADPAIERQLVALFADDSIDWQHLARPAASLLKMRASDELLHAYLRRTINISWELEQRFIAMCREPGPFAESLAIQASNNGSIWPGSVPMPADDEERRIAAEIASPSVAMSPVRAQYEEHPYPRWLSLDRCDPIDETVRDVLVAGCGTGADALTLAMEHPHWRIVAIDVSARSLAYAIRKARRYGVANVEFRHADLRDVDGDYDRIDAVGVLHHLDDPSAGLRALAQRLRSGGEMTIAVYSKRGREELAPLRAIGGEARTLDELREARQRIFRAVDPATLESIDFFELGQFRDTLYHAHEVAFAPNELQDLCGPDILVWLGHEERGSLYVCKMRKR